MDYAQYEAFTQGSIWYVTRLKDNAAYEARKEYDLPEDAPSAVLKDEQVVLYHGKKKRKNIRPDVSLTGTMKTNDYLSLFPIISSSQPKK